MGPEGAEKIVRVRGVNNGSLYIVMRSGACVLFKAVTSKRKYLV